MLPDLLHSSLKALAGDYHNWLELPSIIFTKNNDKLDIEKNKEVKDKDDILRISKTIIAYHQAGRLIISHMRNLIELQKLIPADGFSDSSKPYKIPLSQHPALNVARLACRNKLLKS